MKYINTSFDPARLAARKQVRKRWRKVCVVIGAAKRFEKVLNALQQQQAENVEALITRLQRCSCQPLPEDSVDALTPRRQELCMPCAGGMRTSPNATTYGSVSMPSHGYPPTERPNTEPCEQIQVKNTTLPYATDYRSLSAHNPGYFTSEPEGSASYEQSLPYFREHNICCIPNDLPIERQGSRQYEQPEGKMITLPDGIGYESFTPNQGHFTTEREECEQERFALWDEWFNTSVDECLDNLSGDPSESCLVESSNCVPGSLMMNMDNIVQSGINNQPAERSGSSDLDTHQDVVGENPELPKSKKDVSDLKKRIEKRICQIDQNPYRSKMQIMASKLEAASSEVQKAALEKFLGDLENFFDKLKKASGQQQLVEGAIDSFRSGALNTFGGAIEAALKKLAELGRELGRRDLSANKLFQDLGNGVSLVANNVLEAHSSSFVSVADFSDTYLKSVHSVLYTIYDKVLGPLEILGPR